jgi:hypothetical protein
LRVAQIWAGKRWGAFFWPRPGHEVVVAFEEGNPDRPMIVGSVYNAQNVPPFDLPDSDLLAGIKSCSAGANADPHANFNGIVFYDRAGEEHVEVHSEKRERSRTESDKQMRVGRNLTTVVGALGSAGSGSGGGVTPEAAIVGTGGWGFIPPHLGKSTSFVVGIESDITLGSYAQYVVGQNFQITTNPMAFQLWSAGSGGMTAFAGFGIGALGSVEMIVGGGMYARYGPQIDVMRGPSLATTAESSLAVRGLVGVLDAVTISANILAAMAPDMVDPFFIASKATETVILGALCAFETHAAWLKQAEVCSKLAKSLATGFTFMGDPENAIFNGAFFAEDSAKALAGLEGAALIQDCSAYRLSAEKDASIAVHGDEGKLYIVSHKIDQMCDRFDLNHRAGFSCKGIEER